MDGVARYRLRRGLDGTHATRCHCCRRDSYARLDGGSSQGPNHTDSIGGVAGLLGRCRSLPNRGWEGRCNSYRVGRRAPACRRSMAGWIGAARPSLASRSSAWDVVNDGSGSSSVPVFGDGLHRSCDSGWIRTRQRLVSCRLGLQPICDSLWPVARRETCDICRHVGSCRSEQVLACSIDNQGSVRRWEWSCLVPQTAQPCPRGG